MKELTALLKENYPLIDWENEKDLLKSGGLDSLILENMICLLEDTYEIEIDVDYIRPKNFESTEAIYNMIKEIKEIKE